MRGFRLGVVRMYVCAIVTSPLLDPTCITWGSLLVSPGDNQSVLALQYKEIVIFKKLPLHLGSVFLQGPFVGQLNLNTRL